MSDDERMQFRCGRCEKVNSVSAELVYEKLDAWDVKCGSCGAVLPDPGARFSQGLDDEQDLLAMSTTNEIAGYRVEKNLGLIYGTCSTVNKQGDKGGVKKSVWNKQDARMDYAVGEATKRMSSNARAVKANAVVGVSVAVNESEGSGVSSFRSTGAVVMGTAVLVVPIDGGT